MPIVCLGWLLATDRKVETYTNLRGRQSGDSRSHMQFSSGCIEQSREAAGRTSYLTVRFALSNATMVGQYDALQSLLPPLAINTDLQ